MSDHPISREVLGRFASCTATADERMEIVRHLLAGCGECQSQLQHCWPGPTGASEIADSGYDEAFERSVERALAALAALSNPGAEQLLGELDGHPPKRQETLVRNHPRYWTPGFCAALITRSHEARFTSTLVMCQQAHLAVLVAESLSSDLLENETVEDCRARAWAALGNALGSRATSTRPTGPSSPRRPTCWREVGQRPSGRRSSPRSPRSAWTSGASTTLCC